LGVGSSRGGLHLRAGKRGKKKLYRSLRGKDWGILNKKGPSGKRPREGCAHVKQKGVPNTRTST